MFGVDDVRRAFGIFSWINNLGAEDTNKIRNELSDLIFHASASLKTILDIIELIEGFDDKKFDKSEFLERYRVCRRFYLDPQALEKCRTHCADLFRDTDRIAFKLAKYGRTEYVNVSELNKLISDVGIAENVFLQSFDSNIQLLEESLNSIKQYLDKEELSKAIDCFSKLKSKMSEDLDELHRAKMEMSTAENHIRRILT